MTMSSIIYFSTLNYIFGYDYTNAYSNSLDLFTLICCIAIYGDTFFCGCCFSKACTKKFHSAIICKNAQLLFKKNNKDIELNIVSNSNDILIKSKNAFALNKSKKKDTENHGYGQKIISDIAKKYNGTYTTKAENEYFSTVTQLNNIDLNE